MVADVRDDSRRKKPAAVVWMWGVLALLGVMTKPAQAGDGGLAARAWMDKVVTAALQLNYEGTFIYRRDDLLVSMRIIHVADGQKERDRLTALSGRPREIIRDADGTVCILPEQKQVRMSVGLNKHFPPRALDNAAVLEKYYRFTVGGAVQNRLVVERGACAGRFQARRAIPPPQPRGRADGARSAYRRHGFGVGVRRAVGCRPAGLRGCLAYGRSERIRRGGQRPPAHRGRGGAGRYRATDRPFNHLRYAV